MFTKIARIAFVPVALVAIALALVLVMRKPSVETAAVVAKPVEPIAKVNNPPPPVGYTDTETTKKAFEQIYATNEWATNAEGKGTSGTGSTERATLLYRIYLQQFLAENKITSVVDAGCGDWEFSRTIDWKGIDYKGYDIVASLVDANTKKYGKPNIQFFAGDITKTELPPADLLISKHVMQHIPTSSVLEFLPQLKKYKYVLLTNGVDKHTLTATNGDIAVGGYRELDMTKPPFSLRGEKVLTYPDEHHMHQVVLVRN